MLRSNILGQPERSQTGPLGNFCVAKVGPLNRRGLPEPRGWQLPFKPEVRSSYELRFFSANQALLTKLKVSPALISLGEFLG
jgi:hypothetical protein